MGSGRAALLAAVALASAGCTREAESRDPLAGGCRIVQPSRSLPNGLPESSGLALSARHEGVLWTHNDSGDRPEVFAVDAAGGFRGISAITGARNEDWEDIAVGPCPGGGSCLYVADTGDNER